MNNYYVYIYYRLDTNEPFYVGKGHRDRWKRLDGRNKHFNNIINKTSIMVTIEKENLTEEEAFYWEKEIIEQLVFEYGFSIGIKNNNSDDHYCHLVNQTWGGEGASGHSLSEEQRENASKRMKEKLSNKENHPMYGVHRYGENAPMYGKHHTKEAKIKLSEINKGKVLSKEHKQKISKANSSINNGMYGKRHSEESKKIMSKKKKGKFDGKDNPHSKSVICLTTKKIFLTIKDAMIEYNIKGDSNIGNCCKGWKMLKGVKVSVKSAGKYKGKKLVWKFVNWNHNKKYRISR